MELRPEVQAHLAEYEQLIESYEPKFLAASGDPPKIAKIADSYSKEAQAWMSKWETVLPNPSDTEGKAVKARIDKLNKRAVRMLARG